MRPHALQPKRGNHRDEASKKAAEVQLRTAEKERHEAETTKQRPEEAVKDLHRDGHVPVHFEFEAGGIQNIHNVSGDTACCESDDEQT